MSMPRLALSTVTERCPTPSFRLSACAAAAWLKKRTLRYRSSLLPRSAIASTPLSMYLCQGECTSWSSTFTPPRCSMIAARRLVRGKPLHVGSPDSSKIPRDCSSSASLPCGNTSIGLHGWRGLYSTGDRAASASASSSSPGEQAPIGMRRGASGPSSMSNQPASSPWRTVASTPASRSRQHAAPPHPCRRPLRPVFPFKPPSNLSAPGLRGAGASAASRAARAPKRPARDRLASAIAPAQALGPPPSGEEPGERADPSG
mmetsp:Transcript_5317/g.18519  ORF Transcript_5317/g.18519 Transcript_5317/m.18519 type:complete len:260 (+) Transcript_5317:568-1347(+)